MIISLARWMSELATQPTEIERKASELVREAAFQTQRDARMAAPVDTGFLRQSITVSRPNGRRLRRGDLSAQVGPEAAYGAYVEFGTSKQGAQPYLTPAAERVGAAFVAAMERLAP